MPENDLVKNYTEFFLKALEDAVAFAATFLEFNPFPYQEEFLSDDSPRIAACCGRQVGKTSLAAIKALHFALAHGATRTLIVSAGMRQSMILFDKILDLIERAIPAKALLTYESRTRVRFANGSEIVALPCGREGTTLRGYTADMVILDEANFIPRTVIDSAIRPATITRPNAKIIMMSTPWTRDHPFYNAISKPELGFKPYRWPTAMNPTVSAERLELEKRTIGEHAYNREYNANFIDDQFSYFPSRLVEACTDDYELDEEFQPSKDPASRYFIGIDFGKHTDHSAIAIIRKFPDGELRLAYLKEFELNTPYTAIIGTVRSLNGAYDFRGGYLDQTGVGEGPYEQIKEFMLVMKGLTLTGPVKEDILGKVRLALENRKIILPRDNSRLLAQLTDQKCEPTASGKLKFTHTSGSKDDQLWALALAAYAALEARAEGTIVPVRRRF